MNPWIKPSLAAVWPLAGALCLTPLALAAQEDWAPRRSEHQVEAQDLQSFQDYLDSHRETAQPLARHPELLRDRRFVRAHHALHDWLKAHPDAAAALRAEPERYLPRAEGYRAGDYYAARMSERDLRSFEAYLDSHDETARPLYQDPQLINDQEFVRRHEALHDWIVNHLDAAAALRADPHRYLWRERRTSAADLLPQQVASLTP